MSLDDVVLICGQSKAGKSASLAQIKDPKGVMFLNTEGNKAIPFRAARHFKKLVVTDPYQVPAAIEKAEAMEDIHTIVLDSITYMMDMFESQYVIGSANTMQGLVYSPA